MDFYSVRYRKLNDNTNLQFDKKKFVVRYVLPILVSFGAFTLLFAVLPSGWPYMCNKEYKIEAGPTYSSVMLALPLFAWPGYGKLSTRFYGTCLAAASFSWWGTHCPTAHALDVISAAYYPLFLWEALTVENVGIKVAFLAGVGITTPIFYFSAMSMPHDVPFNLRNALFVTGSFSGVLIALNVSMTKRWKKELATVVLAGIAGALLVLRWGKHIDEESAVQNFSTTTWGHVIAGIALYVASVNTDVFMS